MKGALDPKAVLSQALTTIEGERNNFHITSKAFEIAYFPIQDRAARLVSVALYAFVIGFVFLVGGYVVWTFSA
jgi:hypothetical protein